MKRYNTYIFDLDGTLLDTLNDLTDSVNAALTRYNLPRRTKDEVRQFIGNGVEKLMERAVPDGKDNRYFEMIFKNFRKHYSAHCADKTQPYPGILPLLGELKRRDKKTAIVSNKSDAEVKELSRIYFPCLIDIAIGESSEVQKKPAPDTVLNAMQKLSANPEECIYIGDSDVDILTASNAGIDCFSVLWGFRDKDFLTAHGASFLMETPEDILKSC